MAGDNVDLQFSEPLLVEDEVVEAMETEQPDTQWTGELLQQMPDSSTRPTRERRRPTYLNDYA